MQKNGDAARRIALVTGGNSGIGLAIAQRLARDGMCVTVNGREAQGAGQAMCDAAAGAPGMLRYRQADLRDPAQIDGLIQSLVQEHGAIEVLVNNAGLQHVSAIEAFPVAVWDEMLAVNLSASFHTIRLALPAMRRRGWGRIINIASISGLRGRAGKCAYNATKHGLIGLTKAVALETAATPITCNAICPGWVHTALVQRQVEALAEKEALDMEAATARLLGLRQPSGRFVTKDQVASLAAYLCSEDAQEVRGAAWTIDGATTAA
ncbi:3-hydroxybutyrate dehydrogenase [Acidovorax facilis]|jgi:3-hydroxybutyrate dehydrogenase|uniref:3-hydroxybutyrate dehydrogenase n=1 Tax=Acidovorax facilis TaxID=12917 RepID=UPI003D6577FD